MTDYLVGQEQDPFLTNEWIILRNTSYISNSENFCRPIYVRQQRLVVLS